MLYKDINLIPQRKSKMTPARVLILILAIITIGSYFGNYFVYEPLKERKEKQEKLDDLTKMISSYGDIATEYMNAQDAYNTYSSRTSALKSIIRNDFPATKEMEAFVYVCPEEITILSFNISNDNLIININATNYDIIGTYIEILKENDRFEEVKYTTIQYNTRMLLKPEVEAKEVYTEDDYYTEEFYSTALNVKVRK